MTASQIRILPYEPHHRDDVLRVQRHLWGEDIERNSAYMRWKYEHSPFERDPLIYLAFDGDVAVGMRGAFAYPWQGGEDTEPFCILSAGDTVVLPSHRRRGILGRIMEEMQKDLQARGYRCMLNMSAGAITAMASRSTGWHRICAYNTMLRPGADQDAYGPAFDPADSVVPTPVAGNPAIGLSARCDAPRLARFLKRLPQDKRLRIARGEAYLNWRYENPLNSYRFVTWDNEALEGYLIARTPHARPNTVSIIDWEASDIGIAGELLSAAITFWGDADMNIWTASLPASQVALLEAAGFGAEQVSDDDADLARGLRVWCLDDSPVNDFTVSGLRVMEPSNWDLRQICSDGT